MTSTKVHIVMRTKDRPILLARALDDVLKQSFQDWRLTIVNDAGVKEPVDELLNQRAEAFSGRAKALHLEVSNGMEAASNAGVASEDSEYVVIHDDDDTWHPDFLSKTVATLDAADDDVAAVAVCTEIVYEEIRDDTIVELDRVIFFEHIPGLFLVDLMRINRAVPISILYRRKVHDLFAFNESLPVVGDWAFNMQLLSNWKVEFLDGEPLAYWHQRPSATGIDGNSVFVQQRLHKAYDAGFRDKFFREYVREYGLGLPLFITHAIDDANYELMLKINHQLEAVQDELKSEIAQLRRENQELLEQIAHNTFFDYLRRKYHKYVLKIK